MESPKLNAEDAVKSRPYVRGGLWRDARGAQRDGTGRRPITGEDLLALPVAGDPQMSPDGSQIVYTLTVVDRDANVYRSHLWLVPTRGGEHASIDHRPRPGDRPAVVSGWGAHRVCVGSRGG